MDRTHEARGSSPLSSTSVSFRTKSRSHGPVAQLGAHHNGIVGVEGSSPSGSTNERVFKETPFV
jgi:hypothetical protein